MADLTPHGRLAGKLSGGGTLGGSISTAVPAIGGSITVPQGVGVTQYDGATSVTPSGSPVTLSTKGKFVMEDITVGAIPQNYGLITWNGSTLTVS